MKLATILSLTSIISTSLVTGEDSQQAAARREFRKLETKYQEFVLFSVATSARKCNAANIVYRQEWGSLSKRQRLEYIDAVKCLQRKPARISKQIAPGARTRYDDFTATHLIRTPFIHFSGFFLPFHRYFMWTYEKALREECGYKGYQPYWDWTISYGSIENSTVFDGSPYSMGGNGQAIEHGPTILNTFGLTIPIPPGSGGGCVTSGPFSYPGHNITLGPVGIAPQGPDGGLGTNLRCLSRDLNTFWTQSQMKPTDILNLVQSCTDVQCWDLGTLESPTGVHGSGHFAMGGSAIDPHSSSNDPAFWLHHTNIDRMWAIWQAQNSRNRTYQVWGTQTAFNNPPSAPVTPQTLVDFGVIASPQTVESLASTIDGPFCYIYI